MFGTGSSESKVFGIRVFHMSKKDWYYRPIMGIYDMFCKLDNMYYYILHRFWEKLHVVRLPIRYGWVDADERMFHACFQILRRYVEEELGNKPCFDDDELYRGFRLHSSEGTDEKAIDLWLWYRDELPALEKAYWDDRAGCYGKIVTKPVEGTDFVEVVDFGKIREPKYPFDYPETMKEKKLRELIELRQTLWT